MGFLLFILLLGYGKMMVMEYVVNCFGFVFVKVNGFLFGYIVMLFDFVDVLNVMVC